MSRSLLGALILATLPLLAVLAADNAPRLAAQPVGDCTLRSRLVDDRTGLPAAGATVTLLPFNVRAMTDGDGRWGLPIPYTDPDEQFTYWVAIAAPESEPVVHAFVLGDECRVISSGVVGGPLTPEEVVVQYIRFMESEQESPFPYLGACPSMPVTNNAPRALCSYFLGERDGVRSYHVAPLAGDAGFTVHVGPSESGWRVVGVEYCNVHGCSGNEQPLTVSLGADFIPFLAPVWGGHFFSMRVAPNGNATVEGVASGGNWAPSRAIIVFTRVDGPIAYGEVVATTNRDFLAGGPVTLTRLDCGWVILVQEREELVLGTFPDFLSEMERSRLCFGD